MAESSMMMSRALETNRPKALPSTVTSSMPAVTTLYSCSLGGPGGQGVLGKHPRAAGGGCLRGLLRRGRTAVERPDVVRSGQ